MSTRTGEEKAQLFDAFQAVMRPAVAIFQPTFMADGTLDELKVIDATAGCRELFPGMCPGSLFFEVASGLVMASGLSVHERVLAGGDAEHIDAELRCPDGVRRALRQHIAALADGRLVVRIEDRTEWLGLEQAVEQGETMAVIGQLAGGIAHDYNNLLVTILGGTEWVMESLPEGTGLETDLADITAAAHQASSLNRQLLALTQKHELHTEALKLDVLVKRMEKMLRRVIGEDIALEIAVIAVPAIEADPGRLERLVLNLAAHAREALVVGGRLRIETCMVPSEVMDRPSVVLKTTYEGPYRGVGAFGARSNPLTNATAGERLGLACAYGIVRQCRGVMVGAPTTDGFEVAVHFPARGVLDGASVAHSVDEEVHGERILVVEDDPLARSITVRMLNRLGFVVLPAADLDAALEVLYQREGQIDLLLADVVLPFASGVELAQLVVKRWPEIKVLYMSGYPADTLGHYGIGPKDPFLPKPFNSGRLKRYLLATLKG